MTLANTQKVEEAKIKKENVHRELKSILFLLDYSKKVFHKIIREKYIFILFIERQNYKTH